MPFNTTNARFWTAEEVKEWFNSEKISMAYSCFQGMTGDFMTEIGLAAFKNRCPKFGDVIHSKWVNRVARDDNADASLPILEDTIWAPPPPPRVVTPLVLPPPVYKAPRPAPVPEWRPANVKRYPSIFVIIPPQWRDDAKDVNETRVKDALTHLGVHPEVTNLTNVACVVRFRGGWTDMGMRQAVINDDGAKADDSLRVWPEKHIYMMFAKLNDNWGH